MATITGNDGSLTQTLYAGVEIRSWQANAEYVVSEVTGFAAVRNRRHRRGLPMLRGTLTGTTTRDVAASRPGVGATGGPTGEDTDPGGSVLVLTASSTATACTWTNTVLRSNIGLGADKVGDAGVSYEFVSGDADDLAEAWDEAPP